jgi:hypothetical protein
MKYEEWIGTVKEAPSLEDQIYKLIEDSCKEAFQKDDVGLCMTQPKLMTHFDISESTLRAVLDNLLKTNKIISGHFHPTRKRLRYFMVPSISE